MENKFSQESQQLFNNNWAKTQNHPRSVEKIPKLKKSKNIKKMKKQEKKKFDKKSKRAKESPLKRPSPVDNNQ
jgi:hypothetical protein